jgi:hypothetical protein
MTTRRLTAWGLAAWLGVVVLSAAVASDIQVTPIVADGRVSASFAAAGAFTDDVRALIRTGLLVTLTYTVDLRRPSTIWLDPTLGTVTVASSVKFDNLTGVYQVNKLQDGHVTWSERTSADADVRQWMTVFERIPVAGADALEPNGDYYVQVRMQMSPRRTFSLWPWSSDPASGRAAFTYIR